MKLRPATTHVISFYARSEALLKLYRESPRAQQVQIAETHKYLEGQIAESVATVQPVDQPGIALGLHQLVDEAVAKQLVGPKGGDVTCRRGCSACCRLHVVATEQEAELALMAADEAGWEIDLKRARQQAQVNNAEQWRHLDADTRACVFLTEAGDCAIYQYRPMSCRKYMVVNDPSDCDSVLKPGHQTLQLVSAHAEIAFSAALQACEAGTLAAMLLREIEQSEPAT
jgi:Fe-S-cluster containining protein